MAYNLGIGGNEIDNGWVSPSEHDILAGSFQIIVDDLERPGAVGDEDGLGVGPDLVKVREVRIDHGGANGVHENAAPDVARGRAVNVASVEDDVRGQLRHRRRRIAEEVVAKLDDVGVGGACRGPGGCDLDADEAVMVGAQFGGDRRGSIRAHNSRHEPGVRCVDARAGRGKAGVSRRMDIDPPGAGFVGQGEVPGEARAGLKLKNVAGERLVEGELEIAVGTGDYRVAAGGRRIRGVEVDLWERGQALRCGASRNQKRGQALRCGASRNQKYEDENEGKAAAYKCGARQGRYETSNRQHS